jgi:multidrug resistance efflux pump
MKNPIDTEYQRLSLAARKRYFEAIRPHVEIRDRKIAEAQAEFAAATRHAVERANAEIEEMNRLIR